ncbi:hypothetical protein BATDEDRAFT_89794 [Batrachochytrium dendrobatidis JAM81]|uniref:Uncharacterized protein n=1 Tax=Batrachochytrium dendrobatidis (strain JAM81 / FGSC 10211) TaxID=684364 RepID=F4P5G7_BATDJ|nr:uncharacterized protein BATDEDRAFT_89794 [Batrachochytrium dendrobatidis JAM81]EGF79412.1 hypothetical protein BATDEDRAFT_89794 [Batrachochytrium dendrobatidis JAM81]|eukprot:XP_006680144.1 hypothetical protein BATDEDRAFT_89794 [Batrachochytrium dendrobatidis JAM81]
MDQPGSNTPTQNQRPTVIVAGPNIFKQGRKRIIDVIDLTTSDQNQQPIDVAGPSTYKQSRKQPVNHNESSNTVSNQIAVLSGRYQKTFNRIKQMLVESKEIRKKKLKEYCDYEFLRFEQWSALSRGEEISGSKYDPDTEKKLKQEYEKAVTRVHDIRRNLKKFMKRHGLRFEEPKADSD